MADVDYDPAAMRTAMRHLMSAYKQLREGDHDVRNLGAIKPPCEADYTKAFHQHLMRCNQATTDDHEESKKQVADALNTLAAIDKQYNNSEIANELGFQHITVDKD